MYTDKLINGFLIGLKNIVDRWGMTHDAQIALLTVSENATFMATDNNKKIIIRVHANGYHSYDEVQSELFWIMALKEGEVLNTPAPIKTTSGEIITTVNVGEAEHFVVAFDFVAGQEPEVNTDLATWFAELGSITAKLHQHSKTWDRPSGFTRKYWSVDNSIGANGYWGDWRKAAHLDAGGAEVISRAIEIIEERLERYGKDSSRFGLVHADLRLANLLINQNSMNIIDFDDCGFAWFSYDFAAAISFHELDPGVNELKLSWVKGYRSVTDFSQADEDEIDTFIMLRRIMLTAWLASHSHTTENKKLGAAYTDGTVSLAKTFVSANTLV